MSVAPEEVSPAERTVGQLIADTIRLYGHTFWRGILIAIPATAFTVGAAFIDGTAGLVYGLVVGPVALGLSYLWASVVATGGRNAPGRALLAGATWPSTATCPGSRSSWSTRFSLRPAGSPRRPAPAGRRR